MKAIYVTVVKIVELCKSPLSSQIYGNQRVVFRKNSWAWGLADYFMEIKLGYSRHLRIFMCHFPSMDYSRNENSNRIRESLYAHSKVNEFFRYKTRDLLGSEEIEL